MFAHSKLTRRLLQLQFQGRAVRMAPAHRRLRTSEESAIVAYVLRGVLLPDGAQQTLWIDGDVLRTEPVADAAPIADGGWIIPGLVDTHTHPRTEKPGDVFEDAVLRQHLLSHRDRGVLLVRTPGTAAHIPSWVEDNPDLPRVRSAGRWLATPGRFFPGYGRDVSEKDLVAAAVEEAAASSGWCKVVGDWMPEQAAVPATLLRAVTDAVHAAGGKVAVHCQTAEGCRGAVEAGVDSLEHGMHLDPALLDQMARQGTALVPTLVAFAPLIDRLRGQAVSPRRDWLVSGFDRLLNLVRPAFEAGVMVLAGTDSQPFGSVAAEIGWLVQAGLPPREALGAASWTARSWLGLPGAVDGAPADLVVYPADPVREPAVLDHPSRIVLRGRVIL